MRIAVIGGGISGLACVLRLLELKEKNHADFEVVLFEKDPRLGGTLESEKRDGFILELGPDSFLSEKPFGVDFSKKLGLENEIIGTRNENRKSFVVRNKVPIPLPEGFYLIAPTQVPAFIKTSLFSIPGKIRMMGELFVPKLMSDSDESVGHFIRRRFGREALERVGQPMLAGIYTGDPDLLSLEAVMPRFGALEKKYGSVIRGLMQSAKDKKLKLNDASGPRYSLFLSFKEGMETLIKKTLEKIPPGVARPGKGVEKLTRDSNGGQWRIHLSSGEIVSADAVCSTVSAKTTSRFIKNDWSTLSAKLDSIRYESVATLNLAYRRDQIRHPLDGFGFVVPRTEGSALVACSFSSQKFEFRAPQGHVLLRAFVGGAFGRKYFEMEDPDLLSTAQKELSECLKIEGKPLFSVLRRYPGAMVQYQVGHLELMRGIKDDLKKIEGLFLTGSSYHGVGIPDCIRDAEVQAEAIFHDQTLLFS